MRYKSRCEVSGRNNGKWKKTICAGALHAILCTAGLLSVWFVAPVPAEGKEPEQKVVREDRSYATFEAQELIVTAQKQEEELKDVPVSVSVMTGYDLEESNTSTIWKVADFVPNMMNFDVAMTTLFSQPTMRGISAPASTFSTAVGLYVDGVPILASPGFVADFLEIERIEVLRGPQGTLYGKNTEAGAISIVTKRPGNDFDGKVMIQGGEDHRALFGASASGPIVEDRLFFSLSGKFDRKDGFVENIYSDEKSDDRQKWYGRGHLLWTPVDGLDIGLILSRISSDEGGAAVNGSEEWMAGLGLPRHPDYTVSSNYPAKTQADVDLQALKVNYAISDKMTFTSISARSNTDWYGQADYDFYPQDIAKAYQDSEYWRLSQEFRLDWRSDRLKYLVGLFADKNKNDYFTVWEQDWFGFPLVFPTDWETEGTSYAIFGQMDYSFTDKLSLVLGLRYEKQFMDYKDNVTGIEDDESWSEISPKVALKYIISPNVSSYASMAKGHRSGGFNVSGQYADYLHYDPEKLWSYEIGIKTALLKDRLTLNASVYYMDIDDMQVEEAVIQDQYGGWVSQITNAAKATAKGAEFEVVYRPVRELGILAGLGISDITYDSFKDNEGDYSGNDHPFAPDYTYNIGVQYRSGGGFFFRTDLVGYADIYLDKENLNKREGYELVNMKVGYEAASFDVYLYGENIFDTKYHTRNYGGFLDIYSDPREIGLQLAYRF